MSTATLIRELTGTFTVEDFSETDNSWLNVEFVSDAGIAVAELQVTRRLCWDDDYEYEQRCVWGVKVVDENRKLDESQRGRGLGTALMANLVAHADREQWNLWLKCEPHRSGEFIVGFYERFGFTVSRYEANAVGPQGIIVMMREVNR